MDLNREEVRFVNRRITPTHVAKYKFLFHDSCNGGNVLGKYENNDTKSSVNEAEYPFKLNDQTRVFFIKNAKNAVMFDGGGGDDYGGGGGGGGGGNYDSGVNYGGDNLNNYSSYNADVSSVSLSNSNSNYYSDQQNLRSSAAADESSRLAAVETYSYADNSSTLPLNSRNTHDAPSTESPVIVSQPERDDTHPSSPTTPLNDTNPYLEQDLAVHNAEDSEDKITSYDTDCGCPESILASDLLNTQDNENNGGSSFHELSALNNFQSEKLMSSSEQKEESCGMDCLYFTLQCCECIIL